MPKKKVNKFLRHEALHTTSILAQMVENELLNHGYAELKVNKKFNNHIKKATKHLYEAYQSCNETEED